MDGGADRVRRGVPAGQGARGAQPRGRVGRQRHEARQAAAGLHRAQQHRQRVRV